LIQLKTLQQPWFNKILLLIWFGVSSWLFFTPSLKLPDDIVDLNDKIGHAAVFMLAVIFTKNVSRKLIIWQIVLFFVAYGFWVEVVQWSLPKHFHRGFDLLDAVADAVGAIVGALVHSKIFREQK
jgi:VanZ family protein